MARGKYKGPKRGSGQRNRDRHEDEEEDAFRQRPSSGQGDTAGKLPPADDSEEEEEAAPGGPAPTNIFSAMGAPGELPPNSSDEEDSDSDDSEIAPHGAAAATPEPRRRKGEDEVDPAQIAKDLERLRLAKEKREQHRQERIAKEGWDRFAPVTATNKPPDTRPTDHPDYRKD